jgi:hypothetical protein
VGGVGQGRDSVAGCRAREGQHERDSMRGTAWRGCRAREGQHEKDSVRGGVG